MERYLASSPVILSRIALVFFASAIVALGAHEMKRPPAELKGPRSASREDARRLISDLHGYDLFRTGGVQRGIPQPGGIMAGFRQLFGQNEARAKISPRFIEKWGQNRGQRANQMRPSRSVDSGKVTGSGQKTESAHQSKVTQSDALTEKDRRELDQLIESEADR